MKEFLNWKLWRIFRIFSGEEFQYILSYYKSSVRNNKKQEKQKEIQIQRQRNLTLLASTCMINQIFLFGFNNIHFHRHLDHPVAATHFHHFLAFHLLGQLGHATFFWTVLLCTIHPKTRTETMTSQLHNP